MNPHNLRKRDADGAAKFGGARRQPLADARIALVSDDAGLIEQLESLCRSAGAPQFSAIARQTALERGLEADAPRRAAAPCTIVVVDPRDLAPEARDRLARAAFAHTCVWLIDTTEDAPDDAPDDGHEALAFLARPEMTAASFAAAALAGRRAHAIAAHAHARRATLEARTARLEDARRQFVDEISPLAHALSGALDIARLDDSGDAGADAARRELMSDWTDGLIESIARARRAIARETGERVDLSRALAGAVAELESASVFDGKALVVSDCGEPLHVACDENALCAAVRDLIASVARREAARRRIELLVWRAPDEVRLAVVTGPLSVRDGEETPAGPVLHVATDSDRDFLKAIGDFERLGARVDVRTHCASGATVAIGLPAAM